MPRLSHTLLAAGLFSLSAGAFAQPPGPPAPGPDGARQMPPMMHMGDRDGRPDMSRADLKARLEARFDRRDINHDGKLDEQDTKALEDQRISQMFARLDTDKNGSISKAEFAAAHEHDGPGMDGPMPGPMGMHRAMMFMHGNPGERMHGRLPFRPTPGAFMRGGPDGKPGEPLTKSAFVDRGLALFDKVDTNHDGKISSAEREAARGALRDRPDRGLPPPPPPTAPQPGK